MNKPAGIESEALALGREERVRLALKLLESIEGRPDSNPQAVEHAWLEEARRRYEIFANGQDTAILAEQIFAEMREEDC